MTEVSARILAELHSAGQIYPEWAAVLAKHAPLHIAVMSEPFLSYVFAGRKTVESRFSVRRIVPYGVVQPDDIVLMKAGGIIGCFTVRWMECRNLAENPLEDIIAKYGDEICGDVDFWRLKHNKKYAVLLGIGDVLRLPSVNITKRDRRAWLTLPVATPPHS